MPPDPTPIIAHLTPPGRGAVATLLVEGPGALEAVEARFRAASGRPLASFASDRLVFGHFGGETGEEVVVRLRTSESLELHCHGGHTAVAMIQERLIEQGCRPVPWQDWAAGQTEDPISAAALVALANARTERTAMILLDQYQGALRQAIDAFQRALAQGDASSAEGQIRTLLGRSSVGRHLVEPWKVVLAGPPNVGKSSLINALVGYRRAIVDPIAGTTRDVVTATTALEGWPVEFSDTAGLREGDHPLEQAGIELARQKLAAADFVLLVFDASQPWSRQESQLLEAWPEALVVHNKADLLDASLPQASGSPQVPGILTSAIQGTGIESLIEAVVRRLVPQPPPPGAGMPFTLEQREQLEAALAALVRNDVAGALRALESL